MEELFLALELQRSSTPRATSADALLEEAKAVPEPQALQPHELLTSKGLPTKDNPKVLRLPNGLLVQLQTNEKGVCGTDNKKSPYTLTVLDPVKKTPVALGTWHTSGGCFSSASTTEVTELPLTQAALEALVAPLTGEAFTVEAGKLGTLTLNPSGKRLNITYGETPESRQRQQANDAMNRSGAYYAMGPSSFSPLATTEVAYG
jgi:hypothetical protein